RWLDHRPVLATTPTALERVLLWARRNRALAATTAAAFIAIITGLVVSLWLAGEARQQERIAIAALADAKAQSAQAQAARANAETESTRAEREATNAREQAALATAEGLKAKRDEARAREAESLALRANNQAQSEARKAKAVSSFVFDLFQAADPEKSKGDKLSARDLLDAGASGVDRFADQPDTRAELQRVLGTSYNALARPEKAVPLLAAAAKAQEVEGRGSPERARTLLALASAESDIEKFADAVEHYREALPVVEAIDGAMADEVVVGKVYYAFALCKVGRHEECITLADAVAEEVRAKVGEKDWRYVEAQNGRATARSVVGRWREMPAILEPLEPLLLNPPPGKLASALTIRANLAIGVGRIGNIVGAAAMLGTLSQDLEKHLGPENDKTLVHSWYLAEYQRQLARYAECHVQYSKLVELRTRVSGATHPLTVDVLSKAALCARSAGHEAAARDFARRAEAALPATDDPPQRTVIRTLLVLANVALDFGERDKATALLARARALVTALKLETSDEVIVLTLIDSQRLAALGQGETALAQVEAMLASPSGQRALGNHPALGIRAYLLALTGKRDAALKASDAARKIAQSRLPEGHPYFAVLDYVDALATGSPSAGPLASLERAAGRKAPLPLAPLWFSL
ncbi:MAG: tetratricopeptide repeat protein, partial [Usitatibacter sp.]